MPTETEIVKKCTCSKCGYSWIARLEYPKMCPLCKSRKWDEPKEEREP